MAQRLDSRTRSISIPPSRPPRVLSALGLCLFGVCACASDADPFEGADTSVPNVFQSGLVSTVGEREYGVAFANDGAVMYFTRRGRRGPGRILVTRWRGAKWSEPEAAPFSVPGDESPFVTADGSTLLFSSDRPLPRSGDDSDNIWVVRRTEAGWGPPAPLEGAVNRPKAEIGDFDMGDETAPLLLSDGTLLFSAPSDPDWGLDLFYAEPTQGASYGDPRPLLLNTPGDETHAAVTPDGQHLVVQVGRRSEGPGGDDLYVSKRTSTGWSELVPLPPPINTPANEGYPAFTPDGTYFFFASDRGAREGYTSIWYVSADRLELGS